MKRYLLLLAGLALSAAIYLFYINGAEKTDAHSHSDSPMSFKDSVSKLSEMNQVIKTSLASDDLDKAHGPLHEVGHVLEALATAAKNEKFSEADMATIKSAKEDLFDAFGEIDKTFHGGEGATYDEVANKITGAMNKLKSFAGMEESPVEAPTTDNVPDDPIEEVDAAAPEDAPAPAEN